MTASAAWDERHDAPIRQWADLALFHPQDERTHYVISPAPDRGEKHPLRTLFQPGRGSDLIVVLHGAIARDKYELPRFEWLGTLSARTENVLYVADPTLSLASDLQIGWYVGTTEADVIGRVVRLAERVRVTRGLGRVLFMGGSAGGFASLMASSRLPGSRALSFNPQITIDEYYSRFVERFLKVALPEYPDFASARAALPNRLSVLDAYPSTARMLNRALIVQNSGDEFHMENHLGHLARQVSLPADRAVSEDGNLEFDVRYFSDGHSMPYRHVLLRYLDLTLTRWDEERIVKDDDVFPLDEVSTERGSTDESSVDVPIGVSASTVAMTGRDAPTKSTGPLPHAREGQEL